MSFEYQYAWQEFREAVFVLVGSDSIRERLDTACRYHLSSVKLEHIPDRLQDDFKRIQELHKIEVFFGYMDAENLSDEEADELAKEIVFMFDSLARMFGTYNAQYESE
jgi:hypothetical protein